MKRILPDSHTDFVFAVAAEEFGIILCVLLVLVCLHCGTRLSYAMRNEDAFSRFSAPAWRSCSARNPHEHGSNLH